MGWSFPGMSAGRNEFNYNFVKPAWAAELPGLSAFALEPTAATH
jgi:hypothetical protein